MYKGIHDIISNQVEMDWLGPTEYRDNTLCFGIWLLQLYGWGAQRTLQEEVSDDQGSSQTSSGGVYGL